MRRERTKRRMKERVDKVIERFDEYVEEFHRRSLFTGPSVYFHKKTLEILLQYNEPCEVLHDDRFFDYLYATLTSWGLHRMGRGYAKLADVEEIKDSIKGQEEQIRNLQPLRLTEIKESKIDSVTSDLWDVLSKLRVSASQTKIVANSKALHHVLPDLIPPIDRQYTLRFFYNHTTLNRGDEATFKEIYPYFHRIASHCRNRIPRHIGSEMNTGETKVLDNAIVGFVLKEL